MFRRNQSVEAGRNLYSRRKQRGIIDVAVMCVVSLFSITPLRGAVQELASFQAGDAGWHMGTLAVGQLDADVALELVVPYRNSNGAWYLDAFNPDGTRLAGFPFAGPDAINVSPTLYNLEGDSRDEILFTSGANVVALRSNGSVLWSAPVNAGNYVPDSGFMVDTNCFHLASGIQSPRLPGSAVFSSEISSPMVADLAGNGQKVVVTGWKIDPDGYSNDQDFNPYINDIWGSGEWGTMGESWSGGVILFNALNGQRHYTYHLHQLVESGLALGRGEANAPLKTYVLNDSDSVVAFDATRSHGLYGGGNLHGQFGKNQRLMSGAYQQGVEVYTADIDGDGLSEVLVPTTQLNPLWQPNETILDDNGAILSRIWKSAVNFPFNQWQNNASMIPLNPDRDNRIDVLSFTHSFEIQFRYWNGIELISHAGWPKNFYPQLPTPPVVGDVDGDGHEEIVIGTYDPHAPGATGALYVFGLNGVIKASVPIPGGIKHIPAIANVYGTGLCVVSRSLSGRVRIHNFGSTTSGPVSWATHRGNARRDGQFDRPLFPAGTPMITNRVGGNGTATFGWTLPATNNVKSWRVYRSSTLDGPAAHTVTLAANQRSYTDTGLELGHQYIYEVAAVYDNGMVRSAPFPVLSSYNANLIRNSGFEEDGDSYWDKWFTGDIDWSNMLAVQEPCRGGKSMKVTLNESIQGGSISQFGQYGVPHSSFKVKPGTLYSFGGFFRSSGLSQNTAHWFEWSSTPTAADPNPRPWRPYPGYFTPHFKPGTAATEWTYANRVFVMPEGFHNAELTHWYTAEAPATGSIMMDDLFFRPLPDLASTNWTTLIPFGSAWRYMQDLPGLNWMLDNFVDTLWPVGFAKFGTGGGTLNIRTPLLPGRPAYFFRKTFQMPAASCEELLLSATCTDEGLPLEVYLNGTKLPTSGIEATTAHGNAVQHFDLAPFIPLLRPGANTIAVSLKNAAQESWDNVAFDIRLSTIHSTNTPVAMSVTQLPADPGAAASLMNPNRIGLHIRIPQNTNWKVESADTLRGPWQLMDYVSNPNNAPLISLPDNGQNGRLPPTQTPTRFYRLQPQ